ncbi:MAG TPA: choice-of-anchor D domain-containing protein [Acidimicrobiales bacterium]|nr:choice-of-anchor D domain-containing protein [Acidimicrobiales bacterium]
MALPAASVLIPAPAEAVVLPPPAPPHNIFTLPAQDAITTVQAPNTALTVNVLRNGVQIGTASGTSDATGLFQVNHLGGVCFTGSTPLLQPQDVVQVIPAGGGGEQTIIQNVTATAQVNNAGVVQVHGTAADALGNQLPVNQLDVRIVNGSLFAVNGRRDIRAGVGAGVGAVGTLTYDTATGTAFTASFAGLSATDVSLAMSGLVRADWLGPNPLIPTESTTFDVAFVPAPLAACAAVAPLASYGVTTTSTPVVNIANVGTAVVISGVAQDATAVAVTLDDTNPATAPVTVPAVLSAPTGAQTFTATIPAAQVASLTDGILTASGAYTTAAGTITGATKTMTKDTVAPPAPTPSPAAGVYRVATSATMNDTDPTAVMHGTTDGTPATAASPVLATQALPIGTTTVRAVAVDPAGNASPETTSVFTLLPGVGTAPSPLALASAVVGGTPSSSPVVVTNLSTAPVNVSGVSVQGAGAGQFSASGCTGVVLIPQGSCTVTVTFAPNAAGPAAATLVVADDGLGSPHTVPLSGSATPGFAAPVAGAPSLDFGTVHLGDAPVDRTVNVANHGTLPFGVTGTSVAGGSGFTVVGNTCGALAPAASCSVTVRFQPSTPGVSTPDLVVSTNAPSGPLAVHLSGNATRSGYWLLDSNGTVLSFGTAPSLGSPPALPADPAVAMANTPGGGGYWVATSTGRVFAFGDAPALGQLSGVPLNKPIVGMAATPSGRGYWLVATDGGIFSFGDARFLGSTGSIPLNKPIVGMAVTPTANGYWLVASDGGIFSFGDARFLGSTGSMLLNKPVVGMAATPTGNGYWLVATDGGIFSFGDAHFFGSTGSIPLNQPIVGMIANATGDGYLLVAGDGGLFAYGRTAFAGSGANSHQPQPFVGGAGIR